MLLGRNKRLLAVGLLPLAVGIVWVCAMFLFLPRHGNGLWKIPAELVLWVVWMIVSLKAADAEESPIWQSFLLSAVSLLTVLVLTVYHDLFLDGRLISEGYIPFIRTPIFFLWVLEETGAIQISVEGFTRLTFIGAWVGVFAASCAGCYVKRTIGCGKKA